MRDSDYESKRQLLFAVALCVYSGVAGAASVALTQGEGRIDVAIDEKPFTAYYFSTAVAKPYLMPLRTASGIIISRNFPVVNSVTQADQKSPSFEPHQRPLYFDHGNIDGLNFWSEEAFGSYYHGHSRQAYGRMSLVNVEETKDGADAGTVRARLICFRRADASSAKRPRHFSFGVTNECA